MSEAFFKVFTPAKSFAFKPYDGVMLVLPTREKPDAKGWLQGLEQWPKEVASVLKEYGQKTGFEGKPGQWFSLDLNPGQRAVVVMVPIDKPMFYWLGLCRKILDPFRRAKDSNILVDLRAFENHADRFADALVSALVVGRFTIPKYSKSKDLKKKEDEPIRLQLACRAADAEAVETAAVRSLDLATGTNEVRHLVFRAGNDLTPRAYVKHAEQYAEKHGLDCEVYSFDKLKKMGAGAFVAVAQGSDHRDSGIVKLSYTPKNGKKVEKSRGHIVLVGKGVTYDTGGVNVKPARSMYGMHGDMAGSAIALSLLGVAKAQKWPMKVTAFLAIADNAISEKAYRPNDVVTSLKGDTIEIIHTDAEGRMMLADTLHLAAEEKPQLILEFSTLTGACVMALGNSYSGGFTNRENLCQPMIEAGAASGERVWPFPTDEDFGECLDSKVADVKQCRLTGGVDHIEAAIFLQRFTGKDVPFVHIDLSAAENSSGLAHVSTEQTGFGVRFAAFFIEHLRAQNLI